MSLAPTDPIQPLFFRHPVCAASHLLFAAWAGFAAAVLLRLARGEAARCGVAVFGLSLVFLYVASGLYHAVPADHPEWVELFRRLDLSAIHVLIAGTCTALAAPLSRRARVATVALAWPVALAGALAKWLLPLPPYPLTIALYGVSAAVGLVLLAPLGRVVGTAGVAWVAAGALIYATGATCELLRGPVLWPGVIGPHEVLHLCDMGGSACHLVFVARYVVEGASLSGCRFALPDTSTRCVPKRET